MTTLLKNITDHQIATAIWIAYLIIWIVLFIYARRWCLKKEKEINHAHKIQQTTLLDDDDIRWEELGIFSEQHPLHEYRAGCN